MIRRRNRNARDEENYCGTFFPPNEIPISSFFPGFLSNILWQISLIKFEDYSCTSRCLWRNNILLCCCCYRRKILERFQLWSKKPWKSFFSGKKLMHFDSGLLDHDEFQMLIDLLPKFKTLGSQSRQTS